MIDLKTLSKQKYIYRIYTLSDEVVHCERYPIIYANSKVVYFKDGRKQEYLNYANVNMVLDDFAEFYENTYLENTFLRGFDRYFWNTKENINEIYKDLKQRKEIIKKRKCEDSARVKLDKLKIEYEKVLKEVAYWDSLK